jgi:four helix bundle suffix protein
LRSFQVTTIIYDGTVFFCERFMDRRSRTVDQMEQAARSGRQNIAEASRAAATSSQTELRLTNVARASLDELLLDFEDFLRQHHLPQWNKNDPAAQQVRAVGRQQQMQPADAADPSDRTDRTDQADIFGSYAEWLNSNDPAIVANTIICLIHQANYLLDQQIAGLEREFIAEGGYSEQLAAARLAERGKHDQADKLPVCPLCGKLMALRTAHQGLHAGSQFWGCTGYPQCKGTRPLDSPGRSDGSAIGKP